jgi:hypothetical protein
VIAVGDSIVAGDRFCAPFRADFGFRLAFEKARFKSAELASEPMARLNSPLLIGYTTVLAARTGSARKRPSIANFESLSG